jgi:hypothetical protein
MEKDSVYLKVDSRNRVTLTKISKQATQLYKARSENGTLILEPVQEKSTRNARQRPSKKTRSHASPKIKLTALKIKTKGYKFDREEANAR